MQDGTNKNRGSTVVCGHQETQLLGKASKIHGKVSKLGSNWAKRVTHKIKMAAHL